MIGGGGADEFFYGFGHDQDTIRDFTLGQDRLVFTAIDFGTQDAEDLLATYGQTIARGIRIEREKVRGALVTGQVEVQRLHVLCEPRAHVANAQPPQRVRLWHRRRYRTPATRLLRPAAAGAGRADQLAAAAGRKDAAAHLAAAETKQ